MKVVTPAGKLRVRVADENHRKLRFQELTESEGWNEFDIYCTNISQEHWNGLREDIMSNLTLTSLAKTGVGYAPATALALSNDSVFLYGMWIMIIRPEGDMRIRRIISVEMPTSGGPTFIAHAVDVKPFVDANQSPDNWPSMKDNGMSDMSVGLLFAHTKALITAASMIELAVDSILDAVEAKPEDESSGASDDGDGEEDDK